MSFLLKINEKEETYFPRLQLLHINAPFLFCCAANGELEKAQHDEIIRS